LIVSRVEIGIRERLKLFFSKDDDRLVEVMLEEGRVKLDPNTLGHLPIQ